MADSTQKIKLVKTLYDLARKAPANTTQPDWEHLANLIGSVTLRSPQYPWLQTMMDWLPVLAEVCVELDSRFSNVTADGENQAIKIVDGYLSTVIPQLQKKIAAQLKKQGKTAAEIETACLPFKDPDYIKEVIFKILPQYRAVRQNNQDLYHFKSHELLRVILDRFPLLPVVEAAFISKGRAQLQGNIKTLQSYKQPRQQEGLFFRRNKWVSMKVVDGLETIFHEANRKLSNQEDRLLGSDVTEGLHEDGLLSRDIIKRGVRAEREYQRFRREVIAKLEKLDEGSQRYNLNYEFCRAKCQQLAQQDVVVPEKLLAQPDEDSTQAQRELLLARIQWLDKQGYLPPSFWDGFDFKQVDGMPQPHENESINVFRDMFCGHAKFLISFREGDVQQCQEISKRVGLGSSGDAELTKGEDADGKEKLKRQANRSSFSLMAEQTLCPANDLVKKSPFSKSFLEHKEEDGKSVQDYFEQVTGKPAITMNAIFAWLNSLVERFWRPSYQFNSTQSDDKLSIPARRASEALTSTPAAVAG